MMLSNSFVLTIFTKYVLCLSKNIDIGHAFNENTISWVGKTPFTVTKKSTGSASYIPYYASNDFSISENAGTHLDAPFHFNKLGWKVADIPLENLLVQGILLDVRSEVKNNTEFLLQTQHLEEWQQLHGNITKPTVMLINFGWASKWTNKTLYFGYSRYQCHFPKISKEAAERIVENGNIVGVGVDTASINYGPNGDNEVHQSLSLANIYNLENVNLDNVDLPARGFNLIIMPMKVLEGVGAPCRVIAVLQENSIYEDGKEMNVTGVFNSASCLKQSSSYFSIWVLKTFMTGASYCLVTNLNFIQ